MSKKEKHIDDIIKESFNQEEEDFDFRSWNDLEDRLDRENDVDKAVVSAFELPEEEVPSSVWSNVNDELDIDTVWNRIHNSLNERRRRALWWWNAASVAFISMFLFVLLANLFNPTHIDQKYVQDNVQVNIDSVEAGSNDYIDSSSDDVQNKGINNNNQSVVKDTDVEHYSNGKVDDSKSEGFQSSMKRSANHIEKKESDFSNSLELEIVKKPFEFASVHSLSPRSKSHLSLELADFSDSLIFSEPLAQQNPQKSWTVGITSGVLSTNLMDALFRESVSSNSLVTPEFSIAINPGIFAQYRTKNNWLIQADLYFNYKIVRRVSLYEQLSYVTRKTELSYQRIHLYGGKRFLITNSNRCSSFFEASIGGFVSYLSDQREYRGKTIISNDKTLSDWNVGLDADLGIVHSFDRLSFAYGTQINKGLLNVMKDVSSKSYNRASTLSTGIYLRIGYQF